MKMKKALFFISNNDHMALEEAINKRNEGYEIFFLLCDSSVRGCNVCRACDWATCKLCTHAMIKLIKPLTKSDPLYHLDKIGSFVTDEIKQEVDNTVFDYSDVTSLKALKYHGVDIGYGAFSTYVTYTRNVMPTFNNVLKDYLNTLMKNEMRQTLVLEKYICQLNPDLIVFHNGRFANLKPVLCIARNLKIDYIVTEKFNMPDGEVRINNFYNDIPHSHEAIYKKTLKAWENVGEQGASIGKAFFENRRNAKYAGDKIYTKDQEIGMLPEGFDIQKRNISIFNSSEDEFFAVSKEWDDSVVFPSQYIGLKKIFEHYKNDETIHFYLRIHPNLKSVPWKSHKLLYELKYQNVTIIPPESPVSSYTLMDCSEKVIIFNSTIGLEGTYWGKPVIALNKCTYSYLELTYTPLTENDVYQLIDKKELPPIKNEINCYKAACYFLGYAAEKYKHYTVKTYRLNHGIEVNDLYKLCGSAVLYAYVRRILFKLSTIIGKGRRFNNLAQHTA